MFEVKVKVEGENLKLIKSYGPFYLNSNKTFILDRENEEFNKMVTDAVNSFQGTVEDVLVTIKWTW